MGTSTTVSTTRRFIDPNTNAEVSITRSLPVAPPVGNAILNAPSSYTGIQDVMLLPDGPVDDQPQPPPRTSASNTSLPSSHEPPAEEIEEAAYDDEFGFMPGDELATRASETLEDVKDGAKDAAATVADKAQQVYNGGKAALDNVYETSVEPLLEDTEPLTGIPINRLGDVASASIAVLASGLSNMIDRLRGVTPGLAHRAQSVYTVLAPTLRDASRTTTERVIPSLAHFGQQAAITSQQAAAQAVQMGNRIAGQARATGGRIAEQARETGAVLRNRGAQAASSIKASTEAAATNIKAGTQAAASNSRAALQRAGEQARAATSKVGKRSAETAQLTRQEAHKRLPLYRTEVTSTSTTNTSVGT